MQGKIFANSANLYEDQAKVLFDYYSDAAEKIVQEEMRIEGEIGKLESSREWEATEMEKNRKWKYYLLIFIIPYFIFNSKEKANQREIESLTDRIDEFKKMYGEIFRDYKVDKMGVAYVPVASQVKYGNQSFIVDHTDTIGDSNFKLQVSKQNDLMIEKITELEQKLREAPVVEGSQSIKQIDTEEYSLSMQKLNQHDYLGELEGILRTISHCMDDLDITSVELPLVSNNSNYLDLLREYGTVAVGDDKVTFNVFDIERHNSDISKFQDINRLKDSLSKHTEQFEDVLKGLMVNMARSVQAISDLKVASVDKVVLESNKILYQMLKAPYNHYSPELESEEIERIRVESFDYAESVQSYQPFRLKESSRVRYNPVTKAWVAENGSMVNTPFGVHQIHQEIIAPIVQNLMEENRVERLKIYNHIKDQKIDYLNKWHQETHDFYGRNRAESSDLINLMRASLREYVAAYNTLISFQKTADSMATEGSIDSSLVESGGNVAESLAAFQSQSKDFEAVEREFEEYMNRLQDDIDLKASKFGFVEYYDAKLRDDYFKNMAVATENLGAIDERKRSLIEVNPLFALESAIPPSPNVEEVTYEHLALNLPQIAKNALSELDQMMFSENDFSEEFSESEYVEEYSEEDFSEGEYTEEYSEEDFSEGEYTEEYSEEDFSEGDYAADEEYVEEYSEEEFSGEEYVEEYSEEDFSEGDYAADEEYLGEEYYQEGEDVDEADYLVDSEYFEEGEFDVDGQYVGEEQDIEEGDGEELQDIDPSDRNQ